MTFRSNDGRAEASERNQRTNGERKRRGNKLIEDQDPVDFNQVTRLGFLVTRSSQEDPEQLPLSYDVTVKSLKFQ